MRLTILPVVIVVLMAGVITFAHGESPATQPATQPAGELVADSPVRKWFRQLADPDPKIRDKAKTDLMGIPAEDLPKLRQLVIESQPISPAQSAALYDIVLQAYLAKEPYKIKDDTYTDSSGTGDSYFLGITWSDEVLDDEPARLGVVVERRLPGFPSYRFLRTGDMILGIYVHPDRPLLELPNEETHTRKALIAAIGRQPGVRYLVLEVLRDGETIRIPVTMAPRPLGTDRMNQGAIEAFNTGRVDQADAYFQENFAPLFEQDIEASNLAEGP